jgi:hypothetical protein
MRSNQEILMEIIDDIKKDVEIIGLRYRKSSRNLDVVKVRVEGLEKMLKELLEYVLTYIEDPDIIRSEQDLIMNMRVQSELLRKMNRDRFGDLYHKIWSLKREQDNKRELEV